MRHRKKDKKLGRNSAHRSALFNNLVTSLLTHGRIETTEAKAKMLRSHADATITWGTSVHALIAKGDQATPAEKAKILHARRQAKLVVKTSGLSASARRGWSSKRGSGYCATSGPMRGVCVPDRN